MICFNCNGKGKLLDGSTCPECKGSGNDHDTYDLCPICNGNGLYYDDQYNPRPCPQCYGDVVAEDREYD